MLRFNDETNTIAIVAKDTGDFVITLSNYELDSGDVVYFTVNDKIEDDNPKIQKVVTRFDDHRVLIRLSSSDTDIPVGNYYYDVQVNAADGRVDTVLGPFRFKVLGGITY